MLRSCGYQVIKNIVGRAYRPPEMVDRDLFIKGVRLDYASKLYLSRLTLNQYAAVLTTVERVRQLGKKFDRLVIDPPEKLAGLDFGRLPDGFLLEQVKGFTIDLTGLKSKFNAFKKRPAQPEAKLASTGVNQAMAAELKRLSALLDAMRGEIPVGPTVQPEPTITAVSEPSGLVDTGRPFSAARLLPKHLSRLINYQTQGRQAAGEIIDDPLQTAGHLLGTQFEFINEIGRDAWGFFPPDFARERLMDVSKAVYQRVDGENAGYTSAKTVRVGDKNVRWFEIALTKQKFQKMHLQTRAFYWLIKEAYFEEIARFIAAQGRIFLFNLMKAIPALIKAALYVKGWIKEPPAEIAKLRAPISFLAVQPASFGPLLEYVADVHPNPYKPGQHPDKEKLEIARTVLPKGATFNEETFVVEGDYVGIEHLIPDPAKKPGEGGVLNYRDQRVNDHMWKNLRYGDKAGRDQLVVMNVGLADFRRYFEIERARSMDAKTRRRVLDATKDL